MILDIDNIRRIFFILGTFEGELIKTGFELILFLLITYMIVSEYTRDQRLDLKYLTIAFIALSFGKIVEFVILFGVLFREIGPTTYRYYFPIIGHVLEIVALVLMINAFLFPILVKKGISIKKQIIFQITPSLILYFLFQIFLIAEVLIFLNNNAIITNSISGLLFTFIKILLLLYAINTLSTNTEVKYRYRYSLILAFIFYFTTPFLRLINILFYNGNNIKLFVAEHPFPLLAVLMLTRVIYLKLVDKAFLRKKLKISEQKYKQEKELSMMKDKFVSTISHELRTPLTSINLYSSLLKDDKLGKVNQKQKESLGIIKGETKRLSYLINDILDLSKLEDKKIKLNISRFNIYDFCNNNSSIPLADQKGIKIKNEIPKDLKVNVDSEKFKQVLINLLSNAIKYTEKGGKITFSINSINDSWELGVADTGAGIPKDQLNKIFDKFYQVEHHVTRKEGGTGLGLTIAYEIVKLHKGDIKVTSEVGKGTTFTIVIPKNQ